MQGESCFQWPARRSCRQPAELLRLAAGGGGQPDILQCRAIAGATAQVHLDLL